MINVLLCVLLAAVVILCVSSILWHRRQGALFSLDDPAILKLWSKQFADVSTKSYMRGYRDIYPKVNAFHKLMIRFCDNLVNMVIVKIVFGGDKA